MSYAKPFLELIQEYQQIPDSLQGAKLAHISGGNAYLHRPEEADEKAGCLLSGDYDPAVDNEYSWPDKHAGSVVDQSWTSVLIENALLRYFADFTGEDSTVAMVAGKRNRVRSDSVAFKANGDDYPRSVDVLPDRDVAVGDRVRITGADGSETLTLNTYVRDIVGDTVAGVIDDAYAGDDNKAAQTFGQSVDKIAGADNCIQVDLEAGDFDGRSVGVIDEYYTVEVTQGSTGGDFRTARLSVVSASGLDDDTEVQPELEGTHFAIGALNLRMAFVKNAGASASSAADVDEVSHDDLIAGQTWRIHVKQAHTPATFAEGGTYDGSQDATYVIRVVRGGEFTTDTTLAPRISVTTTNGSDVSGSSLQYVTASGTAVSIGTHGVTWTPTGDGLVANDIYYVPVTAEHEGSMQTLVLGHNLPEDLEDASDLNLELFIKVPSLELPSKRLWTPGSYNWEQDADAITIYQDAEAETADWTVDGAVTALPIHGGEVYVRYREWLTAHVGRLESISSVDDIDTVQGQLSPDNPLKWGVYKAVGASASNAVYFTAVADPTDLDDWATMLKKVAGRTEVYNLAPMTQDRTVQDLIVAHVNDQSGRTKAFLRACFLNSAAEVTVAVADAGETTDGEAVLATVEDNPDVTGTQYTLLTVTSDNVDLVTEGVRAGDVVRYLYESDGFGGETYSEYVIDEVVNERTVVLASSVGLAVGVGQKVEFWRTRTADEVAEAYAAVSASFGNNRVVHVWPDSYTDGDETVPGYFLCAVLAGMRSSVAPHRPFTNVEVTGVADVPRSYEYMDEEDLDVMAESGTWIVTRDETSGTIYTRHGLTTSTVDLNRKEESIRCNADAVGLALYARVKPYIGRANVTPALEELVYGQLRSELDNLMSTEPTPEIGPACLAGSEVREVKKHETQKDKMIIKVFVVLPAPFNYGELHELII